MRSMSLMYLWHLHPMRSLSDSMFVRMLRQKQLAEQEGVDLRLYRVIYQCNRRCGSCYEGYARSGIRRKSYRPCRSSSDCSKLPVSVPLQVLMFWTVYFQRGCKVRITREGEQIFEGELASLKRFKDDVKEVKAGYECGLVFDEIQ